jgi:hypothetical protein
MHFPHLPQLCRGELRGDIPLRHGEHLITHHELLYGRGAQQRRVEMKMEMPFRMVAAVGRLLVDTHGVGKTGKEKVIVAGADPFERIGQIEPLFVG